MKLTKKDFEKILESYSIGNYQSHKKVWWSIQNTLYELKTTKGKFIIKIFKDMKKSDVLWSIRIVESLRNKSIPVPRTFKTNKNNFVSSFRGKSVTVQSFIKGKKIKKVDKKFIKELSRTLGIIDKTLFSFGVNGKKTWWSGWGYQFKSSGFRSARVIEGFDFDKNEKIIINEFKNNVSIKKLRKSIVHGDYHLNNLIFDKNNIQAVIDWDDMHEDFLVVDSAVAVNHLFFALGRANKIDLREFFTEYERYVKLNNDEKKAIYYLIKQRMLSGIVWCDIYRKKHPKKYKKLTHWLHGTIRSYHNFEKISLNDFLKLIEK